MKDRPVSRRGIPLAVLWLAAGMAQAAERPAAGVITRIEPADTGVAHIRGADREAPAAFMSPVYPGEQVVVESLGTSVQVKLFGRGTATATDRAPLQVPLAAPERGLGSNLLASLVDRVARSGERTQRNLVTRGDGDDLPLELSGWRGDLRAQQLAAGQRELFLHWNRYLAQAGYEISDTVTGGVIGSGQVSGDFAITAPLEFIAGRRYQVALRPASGRAVTREFDTVASAPTPPEVDAGLGEIGLALQLLVIADADGGAWAFEAIQGVPGLSPDELDRRALIDELAQMACCAEAPGE
jgi:hypothetical protein